MSYEVKGTIKVINATQQVSEKFSKRELVLTDDSSMYPQDVTIQFAQDKCSLLDLYKVGQRVTIAFNLRGREWINPQGEAKYFNTIEGWKISAENIEYQEPAKPSVEEQKEESTDLPF